MSRLGLFGLMIVMVACDTSRNTPDPEDSYFMRFYGEDGDQVGIDMLANDDGSFILLGNSKPSDESPTHPYLVKVNSHGIVVWEKAFDLGSGVEILAKDIEQNADGGYVILADKVNTSADTDFLLILTDANGQQLATGTFTYPGASHEVGVSVTQIMDGATAAGFIVTGSTDYDNGASTGFENMTAVFARFEQSGLLYDDGPWNNNAGGELNDYGTKVIQRADLTDPNPFVFFGYKNSLSNTDPTNDTYNYWMSKVGNSGEGVSSEILEGSPAGTNQNEHLESVATLNSETVAKYILAGISTGSGQDKVFIAGVIGEALEPDGILSPKSLSFNLGDLSTDEALAFRRVSITPLMRSGFLVAANDVSSGSADMVLMKLNVDGSEAWPLPIVLGGQGDDNQTAIYELPNESLVVFGTMQIGDDRQSKMALIKLNSNGKLK
jgi:hypothetical protein